MENLAHFQRSRDSAELLVGSQSASGLLPAESDLDQVVDWVLTSLRLRSSVFHLGSYCGAFRASTAGHARASYHLVLRGKSFVHLEGHAPIELGPRDGIFFLRDVPHHLTADRTGTGAANAHMLPLDAQADERALVALACGFFAIEGEWTELLLSGLPEYVIVRAGTEGLAATGALFELILAEKGRPVAQPSPLIARLVDALFFYVLRYLADRDIAATGLWSLVRRPELAGLVAAILREPARNWSAEAMARRVHMSRATFFEHFGAVSAMTPGQLLLQLRMQVAARRLEAGESTTTVAEHVGYQSLAAFSRAFKKVIGQQPSLYRREHAR